MISEAVSDCWQWHVKTVTQEQDNPGPGDPLKWVSPGLSCRISVKMN